MKIKQLLSLIFALVISGIAFGSGNIHHDDDPLLKTPYDNKKMYSEVYQKELRQNSSWQQFINTNGDWWVVFNEETGFPHRAMGQPIALKGSGSLENKALNFLTNDLADFNVPVSDLVFLNERSSSKYNYVDFKQTYKGLDILWSNVKLKMTQQDEVIMIGLDVHNDIDISVIANIDLQTAINLASVGVNGLTTINTNPNLKVIPIANHRRNDYKLVYEITVNAIDNEGIPSEYYTLVDAANGDIIYRDNKVRHANCDHKCTEKPSASAASSSPPAATIDVNMTGTIYPTNPYNPTAVVGLPHLQFTAGGTTYYTDTNGYAGINVPGPLGAVFPLEGRYARVRTGQGGSTAPSFNMTLNNGQNTLSFDATTSDRHLSAYYNTNVVHDWAKRQWPSFTAMDNPLTVRVDRTDGSCNAFYNGTSINFYTTGAGCYALSIVADVVYHEYGHGINSNFYFQNGASFSNGAMGEGYADLIALSITQNPILGIGFSSTNPNTSVRRYDQNPKVYPNDLVGEVHSDGEIICGAWWDTGLLLNDHGLMVEIWTESFFATPTAPNGQEGQLFVDILVDALQADDDDGNINNGTPNIQDILDGFAIHGITLLSNADLNHTEVLDAGPFNPVIIDANLTGVQFPWALAGVKGFYKVNGLGTWTPFTLANTSGTNYQGTIPGQVEGSLISYYLGLEDNTGNVSQITPGEADRVTEPNIPYIAMVGFNLLITEDFDNFSGNWQTGIASDDNVTGTWEIDAPIASYSNPGNQTGLVAPGTQHTAGGLLCAFTENAQSTFSGIGDNDVDAGNTNGKTTLVTPTYDLSTYTNPAFSYWRWYTNNQGATPGTDYWQVDISNDGGTSWTPVEDLRTDDHSWRRNVLRVTDYITPTANTVLRFIAEDATPGSIVEAAIDDLQLWNSTATGIEETDAISDIMVYPNPANETIQLNYFLQSGSSVVVQITDELGRIIKEIDNKVQSAGQHNEVIELNDIGAGLYFIKLISDNGSSVKKITIVR